MSKKNDSPIQVKVVLLGETGVGKTSIISRFLNNSFEEEVISTKGANFSSKTIIFKECENKSLQFDLWDTAGQEQYRSLTMIFYKDAKIVLLVYDITRKETFEEIKKYWYKQIKENSTPDIIIAVVANKCDLLDNEEVSEEEGKEFANQIGAIFKSTSCSENIGIEELFKDIGTKFLNTNFSDDTSGTNKNIIIGDGGDAKKKKKCC